MPVRADQDPGDCPLHHDRLRELVQARQLHQGFGIGNVMSRERLQCADLRFGSGHAGDALRNDAKLLQIGDGMVLKIDFRQLDVLHDRARECGQHPRVVVGAAEASERRRLIDPSRGDR